MDGLLAADAALTPEIFDSQTHTFLSTLVSFLFFLGENSACIELYKWRFVWLNVWLSYGTRKRANFIYVLHTFFYVVLEERIGSDTFLWANIPEFVDWRPFTTINFMAFTISSDSDNNNKNGKKKVISPNEQRKQTTKLFFTSKRQWKRKTCWSICSPKIEVFDCRALHSPGTNGGNCFTTKNFYRFSP